MFSFSSLRFSIVIPLIDEKEQLALIQVVRDQAFSSNTPNLVSFIPTHIETPRFQPKNIDRKRFLIPRNLDKIK